MGSFLALAMKDHSVGELILIWQIISIIWQDTIQIMVHLLFFVLIIGKRNVSTKKCHMQLRVPRKLISLFMKQFTPSILKIFFIYLYLSKLMMNFKNLKIWAQSSSRKRGRSADSWSYILGNASFSSQKTYKDMKRFQPTTPYFTQIWKSFHQ